MTAPHHLATGFLLGCCLWQSGWANIYTFTNDDGTVSLSNVPTDQRYTVLITEPQGTTAPMPRPLHHKAPSRRHRKATYDLVVDDVSRTYGLESALLHAVISVESGYNPQAISPKGAVGLMQLMPQTAQRYGVTDALNPRQNIEGGARYLRDLLRQFDNNLSLALAAYNAGEQAVLRHGRRIPPYRETQSYVPRVIDFYRQYRTEL